MRVVSPTRCRPFSADRDGMTLGEGAAILTLETLASAQARNAPIFAEIVGFGMSADANHITQPRSRRRRRSHAQPPSPTRSQKPHPRTLLDQVGYINAHGTGTQANDSTEAAAIHQLFGPRAAAIPVSSTKSLHGHAIGATGAIEALATVLALHHGRLPATAGTTTDRPHPQPRHHHQPAPRRRPPRLALSNSLAFGGLNAVLALRRYTA